MIQANIKEPNLLTHSSLKLFKDTGGNLHVCAVYYSELLEYTGELRRELEKTRRELKRTENALKDSRAREASKQIDFLK